MVPHPVTSPPRRSLGRRLLYAALATLLVVPLAELVARLVLREAVLSSVDSPEVRDFLEHTRLVYDPALGWRPATIDGTVDSRRLGFDFEGIPATPPPGRLRGIALGDSQTRGAGVTFDEAWPRVAERELQARGLDVEVLNAGQPGWRSAQALAFVETVGLAFRPDFLVVDCMTEDGPATRRDYASVPNPLAPLLFESRLYRLLWLGVATLRGEHLGAVSAVTMSQPGSDAQFGPGSHAELLALAQARGLDLVFVDYPWNDPSGVLAGARSDKLPPGATVAHASVALQRSGLPAAALFFDLNHMTVEGSRLTGVAAADTLEPLLRARQGGSRP